MPRRRFALFDSLRAIAALCVVGIHTGDVSGANLRAAWGNFTSHLNVGVTIFFLITGFLLYRPYAEALLTGGEPPQLGVYAKRRFLRIVPAYWVALTLLAIWPGLAGVFTREWWAYYGFAQSYRLAWVFSGLTVAWSLSVEVAFYALLPLFALGMARLCRGLPPAGRVKAQLAVLALLAVASVAFRVLVYRAGSVDWSSTLPAYLLWFAVGMSLAVASVRLADRERTAPWIRVVVERPGACWGIALAVYAALCLSPAFPRALSGVTYTPLAHGAEHVLYAVVACFVMLPAVFGENEGGFPRRVLASRALSGIGVVSYGIFLWHYPLLKALPAFGAARIVPGWPFLSLALVILPVAIFAGWLSFRLVERPAMRLGGRGA